jgi:FkbM family methyltransferase
MVRLSRTACVSVVKADIFPVATAEIVMVPETTTIEPHGALAPGALDRSVIAMTSRLPVNWLGMRLASGLRRIVMKRLLEDGGVDVQRWRLRLRLHPRDNGCEKNLLFTPQFYEVGERAALAGWIAQARPAGQPFVFIDIGANVGLFSFFVASSAGGNARILAIEPERENLRRLRFNIEANAGVPIQLLPHALGESAGTLAIEPNTTDRGGTRTRPSEESAGGGVQVECKTLAQVLAEQGVTRIDALKIDVEGAEDRILLPFFKREPVSLWPRFIIIKDSRKDWRADLFPELHARDYKTVSRTRQNVMLALTPQVS